MLRFRKAEAKPKAEELNFHPSKTGREPRGLPSPTFKDSTKEYQVEELLLDEGKLFSASSVAVYSEGKMYVGGVFGPGFIVCPVK